MLNIHNRLIQLAVVTFAATVWFHPVHAQAGIVLKSTVVEDSDDNRFFLRTGGIARDDVTYRGLVPGQRYTLVAQLFDVAKAEPVGDPAFATLTPKAAEGSTSFQFPVPPNRTPFNIDYAVHLTLYEGEVDAATMAGAKPLAQIRDEKSEATVIQVHAVQRVSVTAADAGDGDQSLQGQGGTIRATVEYENLVEGYHYTLWGELLKPSGQATGIYASIPDYAPEGKKGSVTMEFTVPEGFEGVALVPSVGLYHQSRVRIDDKGVLHYLPDAKVPVMIASDPNLNVAAKTVAIGTLFEDQPAE